MCIANFRLRGGNTKIKLMAFSRVKHQSEELEALYKAFFVLLRKCIISTLALVRFLKIDGHLEHMLERVVWSEIKLVYRLGYVFRA